MIFLSSRLDTSLLDKGLNLSLAIQKSSESIGGSGGGHAHAAGARFPANKFRSFLSNLNKMLNLN